MIVIGLFLSPPTGFQWLLPVYFLKLLVGFTVKENIGGSVHDRSYAAPHGKLNYNKSCGQSTINVEKGLFLDSTFVYRKPTNLLITGGVFFDIITGTWQLIKSIY